MRTITRYVLAMALAVMCVANAVCGPPVSAQSAQEAIAQALAGLGVDAGAVELLPGEVRVTYEQPMAASAEDMIVACLRIMEAAAEQVPDAARVVVHVDYIGEPLLEIAANAVDVRALTDGWMGPDVFAERLVFNERRLPERALRENMATLGIWTAGFRVEGPVLRIAFVMPGGVAPEALPAMAVRILRWVADKTAGLERTVLHVEWPDGTITDVGAYMADVLAWRSGALPESDLTARLDWISPPPTGARSPEQTVPAVPLLDPLDAGP